VPCVKKYTCICTCFFINGAVSVSENVRNNFIRMKVFNRVFSSFELLVSCCKVTSDFVWIEGIKANKKVHGNKIKVKY
jgi:hypothetical protein